MPFQNYMRRIAISQIMNKISLIITIIIYQLEYKTTKTDIFGRHIFLYVSDNKHKIERLL